MERQETVNFLQRIKSYYQEFVIDPFKIEEWHKTLKKYDYHDVNKKLDDHLSSEVYGDQIPKLYFLIRYLTPIEEKGKKKNYTVICQLCNKEIAYDEYDNHYARCSASKCIVRDLKKYFNLSVDYQQLMIMNGTDFDKTYIRYLNKILDVDMDKKRKKIILKCLYPNENININELLNEDN